MAANAKRSLSDREQIGEKPVADWVDLNAALLKNFKQIVLNGNQSETCYRHAIFATDNFSLDSVRVVRQLNRIAYK